MPKKIEKVNESTEKIEDFFEKTNCEIQNQQNIVPVKMTQTIQRTKMIIINLNKSSSK